MTAHQLGRLRSYSEALAEGRVFDGVCVTGHYWVDVNRGVELPSSGFRVVEVFAGRGRPEDVAATCGACEANVGGGESDGGHIAGCHGFLYLDPDSADLDQALRWRIDSRGLLARQFKELFTPTTPLWYGLWVHSPLAGPHCRLLWELLSPLPRAGGGDLGLEDFVAALSAAMKWGLPLHVSMHPPGHADFGWVTTFAHCPRCKAEADLPRWTETVPSDPYACRVCGNVYAPSSTASSEEDHFDDRDRLEDVLGRGYDAFAYAYGRHRGQSDAQIAEALDRHRDGPSRRKVAAARRKVQELAARYAAAPPSAGEWGRLPKTLVLDLPGGLTLELQLVPAGQFLIGGAEDEDEQPVHLVRIGQPLYVGKYPVTVAQWEAVMGAPPEPDPLDQIHDRLNRMRSGGGRDAGKEAAGAGEAGALKPVDGQTWLAAQEFCARLSERVGRHVRLPSEAEWEYACRAGTRTAFAFGDALTPALARFREETDLKVLLRSPPRLPVNVGTFPPNAWSLYDMHGNVAEWCEDAWHDNYQEAPGDGSAWAEAGEGDLVVDRAARGGSSRTTAENCRSAAR